MPSYIRGAHDKFITFTLRDLPPLAVVAAPVLICWACGPADGLQDEAAGAPAIVCAGGRECRACGQQREQDGKRAGQGGEGKGRGMKKGHGGA